MSEYRISINQLADFQKSSDAKKKSIIRQQKTPNEFKMAWYQLSKARIKKALEKNGDLEPILAGIEELKKRNVTKKRQITDRIVSLEAMQKFINLRLPSLLKNHQYEVVKKPDSKSVILNGVEIVVSPDVIIRIKIDDQVYLGAVKIHISKGNKFDIKQQSSVAGTIHKYLQDVVAKNGELVHPELCISLDIFGNGIVSAPNNIERLMRRIIKICDEVKILWHIV